MLSPVYEEVYRRLLAIYKKHSHIVGMLRQLLILADTGDLELKSPDLANLDKRIQEIQTKIVTLVQQIQDLLSYALDKLAYQRSVLEPAILDFAAMYKPRLNKLELDTLTLLRLLTSLLFIAPVNPRFYEVPYSRLRVGTTLPSQVRLFDTFYKLDTNQMFLYNGLNWIEVDWIPRIYNSPDYQKGILRVNDGRLEFTPNGYDWFQVIPTIATYTEYIPYTSNANDDTTVIYLMPGQTLISRVRTYRIRAASKPGMSFLLFGTAQQVFDYWGPTIGGIHPGGYEVSDGAYLKYIAGFTAYDRYSGFNFFPCIPEVDYGPQNFLVNFSITNDNIMHAISYVTKRSSFSAYIHIAQAPYPSTAYYVGNFVVNSSYYRQETDPTKYKLFNATRYSITRIDVSTELSLTNLVSVA